MAIFMNGAMRSTQPLVRETFDKIYFSGQGHTKATFKPMFGDFYNGSESYHNMIITSNGTRQMYNPQIYGNVAGASVLTHASKKAYLGTFDLPKTISNGAGGSYVVTDALSSSGVLGKAVLTELDDNGKVIRYTTLRQTSVKYSILFMNETNVFLIGTPSEEVPRSSSYYSTVPDATSLNSFLLAVNRNTFNITNLTPQPSASPQLLNTNNNYSSTTTNNTVQLVDYDPTNNKATLVILCCYYGTSYYGPTFNQTVLTGLSSLSSVIVTLDGSVGNGSVVFTKINGSPRTSVSNSSRVRNNVALGQAVTIGDKKAFFFHDDDAGIAVNQIHSFKYDPNDLSLPAEPFGYLELPKLTGSTSMYHGGTSIRVLERETDYYLFVMRNLNKDITNTNTKPFTITVLKGEKSDETGALTQVSEFVGRASNFMLEYLDITGDATQMMLCYHYGNPDIIVWNQAAEEFMIKTTMTFPVAEAMVDSLNRMWIRDTSGNIHLQGPSVGNSVRVGFDDTGLVYEGVDISTKVKVSCFNLMGDRVANNVTLQLEGGAAVFSSNASTSLTVMTSVSGDLDVPITIKNNGYVRIVANMAL